jgi:hypothetical protein
MPKLPSPENALPSNIILPDWPGWWPCFNVTNETIPGYAHAKFSSTRYDPTDDDQLEFINRGIVQTNYQHSQELFAGQAYIRLRKPLATVEDMTELAFFTWQHPILPHQFGLCTRQLQRRVLVYAAAPTFQVAVQAPLAVNPDNPWTLYEHDGDTTQFVCLFMDATDPRSRRPAGSLSDGSKPTVCWIEPAGSGE